MLQHFGRKTWIMSRKQKIWFGAIALIIFNAAFIVEDFSADFRYWDLVYILLILVLLTALLAGCFRWNVSNKKNVDTETGNFSKNFWMFKTFIIFCKFFKSLILPTL